MATLLDVGTVVLIVMMVILVILLVIMLWRPKGSPPSWVSVVVLLLVYTQILFGGLQIGRAYLSGTISWAVLTLTLIVLVALIIITK